MKNQQGSHTLRNKTPEASVKYVKDHIESFSLMYPSYHIIPGNICKTSLWVELYITKMYRLYKLECENLNKKQVRGAKYRKLFCEEYNYSFHTPKKDQCRVCNLHQQQEKNGTLTEDSKRLYTQTMSRKFRAREEKQCDKEYAQKNRFYHTVTFDLQAVLHCSCSNVSQVYEKRKLNCFNLSV